VGQNHTVKTKTKIIRAFLEQNKAMTIKEISKTIKADYRITHTATQRLLESQVMLSSKVGSATLCELNPKYYGFEIVQAEEERKKDLFNDKNLRQLHKDIITKLDTTLYILIYHSKNIAEINLLFISNEPYFKKKVEQVLNLIPLQIQATILMEREFKESKYRNQNLIVLHNLESYYLLKCNP
jgi:hypothetical protein